MWEELDMEADKLVGSENKKKVSENESKTTKTTTNLKKKLNENKNENNQQQQTKTNKNKKLTATTNLKKTENEQNEKPKLNKQAKPNSNIKVKGKQISDIRTLRDFLAKKKLEHATRGFQTNDASHTQRSRIVSSRDQPTDTGESTKLPNKRKRD